MKNIIIWIFKFLKECGVLLRVIGVILFLILLSYEAVPDLVFSIKSKTVRVFTEDEIIKSNRENLPRYLKIKNMEAITNMYVNSYSVKKGDTILESIIYPVYNKKRIENIQDSILKKKDIISYIVVKDQNSKEFKFSLNTSLIEGKFDNSVIDEESRNLLEKAGYNIDKNCVLIQTGIERWGLGLSLLIIFLSCHAIALILISFYPLDLIKKVLDVN